MKNVFLYLFVSSSSPLAQNLLSVLGFRRCSRTNACFGDGLLQKRGLFGRVLRSMSILAVD